VFRQFVPHEFDQKRNEYNKIKADSFVRLAELRVFDTCAEGQITPLSRPFKTKADAEKARQKYPERERKTIGVGLVRFPLASKA
jgi:hypothetical protein